TEDANKIISNDAACPVCDQVLSKRYLLILKTRFWFGDYVNFLLAALKMVMAGVSPQIHGQKKRKLDEMYDKLRSEYESAKRSSVQPANFFSRAEPDLFSSMANMMDGRASVGQDYLRRNVYIPGQKWRCCVQALCSASLDIYISTNIERTSTSVSMQMYRCKAALLCICIVIDNNMWKGKVTLHRRQARKAWLL
ncbi:hypothetical protein BHE74_00017911, partial [Ensete ventricosum]